MLLSKAEDSPTKVMGSKMPVALRLRNLLQSDILRLFLEPERRPYTRQSPASAPQSQTQLVFGSKVSLEPSRAHSFAYACFSSLSWSPPGCPPGQEELNR